MMGPLESLRSKVVKIALSLLIINLIVPCSIAKLVITPEEMKAIEKLRPLVKDIFTHDYQSADSYLLRFVKAKKLNVGEAAEMFRKAQQWRKTNKIDTIANEEYPEFANFPKYEYTEDYEGRIVVFFKAGLINLRKITISRIQEKYARYTWKALDRVVSESAEKVFRSNGTLTDPRVISVTDFQGYTLRNQACLACISLLRKFQLDFDKYYPGINAKDIIINLPRLARPVLEFFINIAAPSRRDQIFVFGTNRTEWSNYLRTIVPPQNLPYQFGGTKAA